MTDSTQAAIIQAADAWTAVAYKVLDILDGLVFIALVASVYTLISLAKDRIKERKQKKKQTS